MPIVAARGSRRYLAIAKEDEIGVFPHAEPATSAGYLAESQTVPANGDDTGNEGPRETSEGEEYVATVDTEITIPAGSDLKVDLIGADEEMGTYTSVSVLYDETAGATDLVLAAGTILGRYRWKSDDPAWADVEITTDDANATGAINAFLNSVQLTKVRNTGGSGIEPQRQQLTSDELRDDRQIETMRLGNINGQISIPIEFSYAAFDDLIAAALFGEWDDNEVKAGTDRSSFVLEEGFTDIEQYLLARGGVVNQWQLQVQPNAMITGSFQLMFLALDEPYAGSSSPNVVDAPTNDVFDSFTGTITRDGTAVGGVASLSLNLQNGVEAKHQILSGKEAYRMLDGRSNLTLDMSIDFQNADEYERFINETEFALTFELVDLDGNKYEFDIPRIKYTGNTRNVTENDLTQSLPAMALRDATLGSNIKITRTAA